LLLGKKSVAWKLTHSPLLSTFPTFAAMWTAVKNILHQYKKGDVIEQRREKRLEGGENRDLKKKGTEEKEIEGYKKQTIYF